MHSLPNPPQLQQRSQLGQPDSGPPTCHRQLAQDTSRPPCCLAGDPAFSCSKLIINYSETSQAQPAHMFVRVLLAKLCLAAAVRVMEFYLASDNQKYVGITWTHCTQILSCLFIQISYIVSLRLLQNISYMYRSRAKFCAREHTRSPSRTTTSGNLSRNWGMSDVFCNT